MPVQLHLDENVKKKKKITFKKENESNIPRNETAVLQVKKPELQLI